MKRKLIIHSLLLTASTWGYAGISAASESDPWTYAHIPLADSAAIVNTRLKVMIQAVIDATNEKQLENSSPIEDTALEFSFFGDFRSRYIRDVAWGVFERCIGTNSCPGWPPVERIQMYPEESVYHAAKWRFIPARYHLASIIRVCGVRMGADKLTHFFDDAFHYFNALRRKRRNFEPEDIRQLSMAFERSYMGTRLTGIVSRADVEANLSGVEFYGDFFGGSSPMIGRNAEGRLMMRRDPDICDYVTNHYDERILPNQYSYSLLDTERARKRASHLNRVIDQRVHQSRELARTLNRDELYGQKKKLLARRIPMTRWQKEFPKMRLIGHAGGILTQLTFDSGFRRALRLFGFNPLKPHKLKDRKPITIQLIDATS